MNIVVPQPPRELEPVLEAAYVEMYLFDQMPPELRERLNNGPAGFPANEVVNLYVMWKQQGLSAAIQRTYAMDRHVTNYFNSVYQMPVKLVWKV